jgi:2-amino-4-hydroxy-6-hydroxymethyldihydropteridine diphosphokinase
MAITSGNTATNRLEVYLGLGSNIEPTQNIANAKAELEKTFTDVHFSATYESQAVGFVGDNFHNLVAKILIEPTTTLPQLINQIKQIEDNLGRIRGGEKFSSRHIDIDILLFSDRVCECPIVLPREEIRENAYVLRPLVELSESLSNDLKDPRTQQSYYDLWQAFDVDSQPLVKL